MRPFLNYYDLPKTLDELNREQNKIEGLIREQNDKLEEELKRRKKNIKNLKNFYVLESTIDNRDSELNKLISEIELELYKLNATHDFLERNRWRYKDQPKESVQSVGTSPEPLMPAVISPAEERSILRSIRKSLKKTFSKLRTTHKKAAGGKRRSRTQRRIR